MAGCQPSARFQRTTDLHNATRCGRSSDRGSIDSEESTFFLASPPPRLSRTDFPRVLNLPHRKITESKFREYPADTLFVTYCAGPHCNGATRGAIRLAKLGRPVKIMIGGVTGWFDEGFALETQAASAWSEMKQEP
ncbi:rhodanese-like domain-containing protein [Paraburkholderia terrae]|uniref:rhodanese-like domain-containing protein n=1 Tax=Paraburkholderia terrae TaxID=311230 RepID=UPI0037C79996